ncbi:MAG: hypothetical protein ACAF41_12500 [Leptolyngbya sp. BL-A-14]
MDDNALAVEKRIEISQQRQAELDQARANLRRLMALCDAHIRALDALAPKLTASASAEDYAAAQTRLKELDLESQQRDAERQQAREEVDRRSKDYAALIAEYSQASDNGSIGL